MNSDGNTSKKVTVAMSGGVDSAVAALLIKNAGYITNGATAKMSLSDNGCCNEKDIADARAIADKLGFSHSVYDLSDEFDRYIKTDFINTYISGGTPNPCILCNALIKFGLLADIAQSVGSDFIATGHYARVEKSAGGRYLLKTGVDAGKDQSYVLYRLTQNQLARTLFPLGGYNKTKIREIAEENGFVNAHKKDSQDICFIPDGDYAGFIERQTGIISTPGDYIDRAGNILGKHKGIVHYTIGQRKGLGIALGSPAYVCDKDPGKNTVTLCTDAELFSKRLTVNRINLIACDDIAQPTRLSVKVRYRHKAASATVVQTDTDRIKIEFDEPQRAFAGGQSAVFYDGDIVVGGGIII